MRLLLFILALLAIQSTRAQSLPRGEIIDSVFCDEYPEQSYALYLPTKYDSSRSYPLIIIFDPAARGILPVRKFQPAAEELGYILIGSNNSKNGSWDLAFEAGEAMFNDAMLKYKIDPKRIYTSGFSGGSRVASAVASLAGQIRGVIACGAGFASVDDYQLKRDSKVHYVALIGDKDMNYQEHRLLQQQLDELNISNEKLVFPAGHQWPPSAYLLEAINWLELQGLKEGLSISPDFFIERAFTQKKARADSVLQGGNYILAHQIYSGLITDFNAYVDIENLQQTRDEIKNSKEYSRLLKREKKINDKELTIRREIGEAFTELHFTKLKVGEGSEFKDMNWWQTKVDEIKRSAKKDDFLTRNMALRLLNMIWARCAESSFSYMNSKDYETAFLLNQIWLYTEPNLWGKWNMAQILAYMDDTEFFTYLQEVVEKSQSITVRSIKKQPAFQDYLAHEKMILLIEQIEARKN
ncbi:hypothetical protein E1176_15670 [Fulvivirga sp. RKSG066]|uniref:hypothetical protein n=1 Tax=Fulvivirga aurantia TaxID=2529383 RepID=UPI0012BD598A|nr:hypothetical protein [Fulvivirga aurantia]MTI22471.1 hypothetical protein [Fulvivirga aurantia]